MFCSFLQFCYFSTLQELHQRSILTDASECTLSKITRRYQMKKPSNLLAAMKEKKSLRKNTWHLNALLNWRRWPTGPPVPDYWAVFYIPLFLWDIGASPRRLHSTYSQVGACYCRLQGKPYIQTNTSYRVWNTLWKYSTQTYQNTTDTVIFKISTMSSMFGSRGLQS